MIRNFLQYFAMPSSFIARPPSLLLKKNWPVGQNSSAEERRLERVAGIEPASSAWKADVLPLYDTRTREDSTQTPHPRKGFANLK